MCARQIGYKRLEPVTRNERRISPVGLERTTPAQLGNPSSPTREPWRRPSGSGLRPPRAIDAEPGEWAQGWQYHSSLVRNNFLRETVVQPRLDPASLAVFRSQSGPRAGAWLTALPTEPGLQLKPLRMQIALRRRLRLPLPLSSNICGGPGRPGCRGHVDV